MASTVTDKLVKGGIWLGVSRIFVHVFQIISTIVVAWFLSPEDYGLVGIAMTVMIILTSITSMQLGEALIRHQDKSDTAVDTVFTLGMLRGVILAALMALAAYPIAEFYGDPRLLEILQILSLIPLVSGLANPRRFLAQRDLNFRFEVIIALTQKMAAVIVTLLIAYFYQTYWALVIGALVEQAWGAFLSYMLIRYRPRLRLAGVGKILNFSIWLTLGQAINTLNWRVEFLIIGKVLGTAPLGIYRMGSNLAQTPTSGLMAPIRQVVYPGFTSVIKDPSADQDPERIRTAYQRTQSLTTVLALPVGIGFALIADPLVRFALDSRWHDVVFILQFLSAVFAFQTLGALVQPLAMAKNQTRLLFIRDTQMLFIRLPIIIGGLYFWGLPGVVAARVVSGAISMLINMTLVRRLIGLRVREQFAANLRAIASIAIMCVGVGLISAQFGVIDSRPQLLVQILVEIVSGFAIYGAAMALIWLAQNKPEGPETEILRLVRRRLLKSRA